MVTAVGGTGIWNAGLRFGDEAGACAATVAAEEAGYTAVWLPDGGGDDLFPRITALLSATSRIVVATGILNLWMHEPSLVATRYAELNRDHPGRFLLGIGVSHSLVVDQGDQKRYRRPLARTKEYLDDLDAADPPVPADDRVLAALGPKMLELSRDRAAGAHPYLVTPEHTAAARTVLGPGKVLAPEVGVVLDPDLPRARETARAAVAMYLNLPNYVNNWRRYGFTDEDVTAPGSDRLIDALFALGNETAVAARLREHRDAGADHITIQVLTGSDGGMAAFPVEQWRRLGAVLNR